MSRALPAVFALALVAATARGDRPPGTTRVAAPAAARAALPADGLPRFALFGWVSPPEEFATSGRYAELAGAGFNTVLPAWNDSGLAAANLRRLDLARPLGLRCLLVDVDLDRYHAAQPATHAWADTVVARYAADPAYLGCYLGDEPEAGEFPRVREWFDALLQRDGAHPPWNNLYGRMVYATRAEHESYLRHYVDTVRPRVLCVDQYDFLVDGDRHQLVECAATVAAVAREHGLPFWGIVQLVRHRGYRDVGEGVLRWQMGQWLAFGARGLGVFTYWTPAPDSVWQWSDAMLTHGGARTPLYDMVRRVNARAGAVGRETAGMAWLATEMAGSVEPGGTPFAPDDAIAAIAGRATLGTFVDSLARVHVLVVNADSAAARTVTLTLAGASRLAWVLDDAGAWSPANVDADGRCALALAAGDFTLLRLSDPADSLAAGRGAARLRTGPNPARGLVRFTLAGTAPGARLEVLDLAGRRVWMRDWPAGGSGMAAWDGTREGGGQVPPGVYLARLEDAHGVVARRVHWLGGH